MSNQPNLGFGKCSKCGRDNQPIKIRWYDANRTQCCVECYDENEKEVQAIFQERGWSV